MKNTLKPTIIVFVFLLIQSINSFCQPYFFPKNEVVKTNYQQYYLPNYFLPHQIQNFDEKEARNSIIRNYCQSIFKSNSESVLTEFNINENELRKTDSFECISFYYNDLKYTTKNTSSLIIALLEDFEEYKFPNTKLVFKSKNKEFHQKTTQFLDSLIQNTTSFNGIMVDLKELFDIIVSIPDTKDRIIESIFIKFYLDRYGLKNYDAITYFIFSQIENSETTGSKTKLSAQEKIDLLILLGDSYLKEIRILDYQNSSLEEREYALKAYLKAYEIAFLHELYELQTLIDYKISNVYDYEFHVNLLYNSESHLNQAIKVYKEKTEGETEFGELIKMKGFYVKYKKYDGLIVDTYKDIPEINKLKCSINNNPEAQYYFYSAMGLYFASTRLESDLIVSKKYFEASLAAALISFKENALEWPKVRMALNYLVWMYGNLNDEKSALELLSALNSQFVNKLLPAHKYQILHLEPYYYHLTGQKEKGLQLFINNERKYNLNNEWNTIEKLILNTEYYFGTILVNGAFQTIDEAVYNSLYRLNSIEIFYNTIRLETLAKKQKKNANLILLVSIILACFLAYFAYERNKKLKKTNEKLTGKEKEVIAQEKKQIELVEKNKELENKKYESDKKAAISQVLARCMSHNIGSHALSKFMDKGVILKKEDPEQYITDFPSLSHEAKGKEEERKELIANFNEYLKYRMDFLADIATTSQPFMESPMYFGRDLFKGLDKNRILLNRISGVSSDVSFEFKIFINDEEIITDNSQHDKLVSIPNNVLGAQAFYIILENIIRNIYKHGNPLKKDSKKKNEADLAIEIHLNESKTDKSVYKASVFDTNFKTQKEIAKIVEDRNETFMEEILSSSGDERLKDKLRSTNLGTIEMAACAAYLKGWPVDKLEKNDVDHVDPRNTVIYAYTHTKESSESENNSSLGYRFYLNKPKEVLVVSEKDFKLIEESDDLENLGIQVVKPEELNTDKNFSHQFIYFDEGTDANRLITADNRAMLPKRVIQYNESIRTDTKDNFIEDLWRQHVNSINKGYTTLVGKYLERAFEVNLSLETEVKNYMRVFIDDHNLTWKCRDCDKITDKCNNEEYKRSVTDTEGNSLCEPLKGYNYYEMECSHSHIKKIRKNLVLKPIATVKYEYTESVLTSILVLDERIQSSIAFEPKRMYANQVCFHEYFRQQSIIIPLKEEVNLNADKLGNFNSGSESDNLKQYVQMHIEQADFCIIHLGILERIVSSGKNKSTEEVEKVLSILFPTQEQRKKVVITSGRGGALNVKNDLSFIPLAMLENALLTLHDKSVLTKLLYNSRKSN